MTPSGVMAPSAYEIQLSNESLIEHNPASSAAEHNMMATPSTEDAASSADENLGADENVGMSDLVMDGHNSGDEILSEEEDSEEFGSPSGDTNDADYNDSDGNTGTNGNPDVVENSSADESSSVDKGAGADPTLDHNTNDEASKRFKWILADIAKAYHGVREAAGAAKKLKRKVDEQAEFVLEAQQIKAESIHAMKRARVRRDAMDKENLGLRRELKKRADRDVIKKESETLRQELFEKTTELQKELNEKADYHDISEQRREFHRELIEKTSTCRDLEWKVGQLQRELNEKTDNCKDLEKKVAELQRQSDEEASFTAQIAAIISNKSKK